MRCQRTASWGTLLSVCMQLQKQSVSELSWHNVLPSTTQSKQSAESQLQCSVLPFALYSNTQSWDSTHILNKVCVVSRLRHFSQILPVMRSCIFHCNDDQGNSQRCSDTLIMSSTVHPKLQGWLLSIQLCNLLPTPSVSCTGSPRSWSSPAFLLPASACCPAKPPQHTHYLEYNGLTPRRNIWNSQFWP